MQCSETEQRLNARMGRIEGDLVLLKTAFLRNDLGAEDYDGHRRDHGDRVKSAAVMEEYKQTITKKIINVVLGVALTALGTGIVQMLMSKLG